MLEDQPVLSLPPRSRLFSLPPAGEDGCTREALLDYTQRLSVQHRVRVRDLLARIVLPEAEMKGAFYVPGHFTAQSIRGCSGWSSYAQSFLGAVQRLTGRLDVEKTSLAGWHGLLNERGYVARGRRWCPECLREQEGQGFHHLCLLWSFDPVRVCPKHLVWLCEQCMHCGKQQPVIGNALARGLCEHCHHSLQACDGKTVHVESAARECFDARALAGMIESSEAKRIASCANYQDRLRAVAVATAGGSLFRLERQLNLSYGALLSGRRPGLRSFLEVMYRLGEGPVAFLEGSAAARPTPGRVDLPFRTAVPMGRADIDRLEQRVEDRLLAALSVPDKVTTRTQLVRDLGISNACLSSHFRGAQRRLRAHNDQARPKVHAALWSRRATLVNEAVAALVAESRPLSASFINEALRTLGLHRRNPRVRRLVSEAIGRAQARSAPGGGEDCSEAAKDSNA